MAYAPAPIIMRLRCGAGEGYVQAIGEQEEEDEEEAVEILQVLHVVLRDCVGKYIVLLPLLSMTCALSSSTMVIHLGLVIEGGMGNGETTDDNNTNNDTGYSDNDSSDHGSVSSSDIPAPSSASNDSDIEQTRRTKTRPLSESGDSDFGRKSPLTETLLWLRVSVEPRELDSEGDKTGGAGAANRPPTSTTPEDRR